MKKQNILVMTALVFGLMACGSNDDENVVVAPPAPTDPWVIGNVGGGTFQDMESWNIQQLQARYGNVTISNAVQIGYQITLPAGTHSWQVIADRIKAAALDCQDYYLGQCQINIPNYGGYNYNYVSPLAMTNFSFFRNQYIMSYGGHNYRYVQVRYTNDPGYTSYNFNHTFDQLVAVFSQGYGNVFQHGYQWNSYPVYQPGWSVGAGLFFNLNFSSGGLYY